MSDNKIPIVTRTQVYLNDPEYFCNKSWTLSFNVNTKTWVSFHSYIPNFYIAENNFFYSGINGCCDEFDLVAGEIVPNPPTTTTTSTQAPITTTTTTTPATLDCTLVGIGRIVNCTFSGTAVEIFVPCTRPTNLRSVSLITGYNIIIPPSIVVSTGNQVDACNTLNYYIEVVGEDPNIVFTSILSESESMTLGQTIYNGSTGTDCTKVVDGWYFTDQSAGTTKEVYHIVSGVISEIVVCLTPTTTTTTTLPCTLFRASKTAAGISTINYTTCDGVPAIIEVGTLAGGYSQVEFCAYCCTSVPSSVTLTNIGGC